MRCLLLLLLSLCVIQPVAAQTATVSVEVRSDDRPVRDAEVVANGLTQRTDADGRVRFVLAAGDVTITAVKPGFAAVTATIDLQPGQEQSVLIQLPKTSVEESVTVSATRSDRGVQDQALRVEVLDPEEIGEKLMMTPGDVVMMLNEMGGMRVQATSPSLGAASIRIQGMPGRYTRFLSDGLPLYGEQVSLGLMQIPPLDLARVEVIKGVASSLYGAGALGGVVNLVSRRPGTRAEHTFVINRSSRGATDLDAWYSAPLSATWGITTLASVNGQSRTDVDDDGWADLPKYARGVIRPRLFYDNHAGRSFFVTAGGTIEDRRGGSVPDAVLPATGIPYVEALNTRRWDTGALFQATGDQVVWTARGSWATERQDHTFGDAPERDDRNTGFAELTARGRIGSHTFVAGAALEHDVLRPREFPQFGHTYTVPALFLQDDVDVSASVTASGAVRVDQHNVYGTFASPHVAALVKHGPWSVRLSYGTGFSAPTVNTEETDAAGLSRLTVRGPLVPEKGRSASLDLTHKEGPLSATLTVFHSRLADALDVERRGEYTLTNLPEPSTSTGVEALAVWKTDDFSFVANYGYVRAVQTTEAGRVEVPLTPRHSIGLDAAWEWEGAGRLGVEWFYTGQQRLEDNPYRSESRPYSVFGVLAVRRLTPHLELFLNGENLTDVRQSRWDPLIRPARGADGRWTVDAWAPLDGRNINGGLRVSF